MTKTKKGYCLECPFRKNQETNKPLFCALGYTQNPETRQAFVNSVANNAELCERARNMGGGKKDELRTKVLERIKVLANLSP